MPPMKAEGQMERAEPAKSRSDATGAPISGVTTKCGSVAPSASPREIVVYCEGFGAGPGCGWFVEVSFVEWNHGGFSVFLRTDEDAFEEDYPEEGNLAEEYTDDPGRARRVATVEKPLTWRRVLQMLRRLKCLRIADDSADIGVQGMEPWQRDVVTNALLRGSATGPGNLTSFFSGLPDEDLRSLHARFGGLFSEEASEVLPDLADAVLGAGLRKTSLPKIAQLVGVEDPWDLRVLTDAVLAHLAEQ